MEEIDVDGNVKKLPWPKAGDVLFKMGDDYKNNACLSIFDSWEFYAMGYKDAATSLVNQVAETQSRADSFVYPITFLYRHYLELRLKRLISIGQELTDRQPDLKHIHRLDVLWKMCREMLEEVWPGSELDALDAVGDCINQFMKIDPESMCFRYPVLKTGQPSLPTIKHINLTNLKEVMERTSMLLECASMGLGAYLDDKRSVEASYY